MASVWPVLLLLPLLSPRLQTRAQPLSGAQPVKVLISNTCAQDGARDAEMDLEPGSPLVLTHRIRLLPGSGSACGQCEVDFAALRERIERLEKEVSELREKCGGADGCCGSQQSKGALCTTVRPTTDECPDDCSDQGRCVDGKCVCFSGFSGPDCSIADCPDNCSNRGRCVDGQCVCDPGFSGPDCSSGGCPDNCNNKGRCVNGQCVCDTGFTGQDCSERSCPGNCNNRGRCVNGQCVCSPGFSGPDCSVKACPDNCNNRGQCVNGKCVCESGFTGPDCSSRSCPGDCSDHGRCVDGTCVCESGFTGPDCLTKACPGNCNNKGRCVNGQCVCDVGFSGQDCSTKTCPNNCSNRGRCVRGRCVCRRIFTGPDCSECQSGFTGENCDTALMGVSRLSTRDISESSVTVFWTPPTLLYDSYHITFTSTKETDQKISSKISGRLSSYTQTGLAAGQEYTVTIIGEKDGMMGSESAAQFTTLISGPKNFRVVKTSTTSVIVQWEKAQGEIDRYVLSVAPNQTDGSSGFPEMNLPPERDSAQINGLDPGRLYDLSLVAERNSARSLPAIVQATPGKASASAIRMTVGIESGNFREKTPTLTNSTLFQRNRPLKTGGRVENSDRTGNFSRLRPGMFRPGVKRPLPIPGKPGMFPKPGGQPGMIRRTTPGIKHLDSSRTGTKGQIVVLSSNQSTAESPLRPMTPTVDLVSHGKPMALTMKEAGAQEGFGEESVETPVSSIHKHTEAPSASAQSSEPTEEPTTTTEKNLTAYINGTKCVRKVLVGYKKIHGNMSDGALLSKNMTVVVGHVNGNDLLHNLLTGRSMGNTGLDKEQNTVQISEARGTVKEEDVNEESESVTPFSTRQPETAHQLPQTSTPANQPTEERPQLRNTIQSSLAGPQPPPSADRPNLKTSSSPLNSPTALAEEPTEEKEELNSRISSTTEIQDSPTLPVRFHMRSDSVMKNRHAGASDPMVRRRTPYRPSSLHRPHVSASQNHTRPVLDPAEYPRQDLIRRNRTVSRVGPAPASEIPAGRTGSSLRDEPNVKMLSRGSPVKHRDATRVNTNTGPDARGNSDGFVSNNQLMENDNKTQKYELRQTDGSIEVNKSTPAGLELTWTARKGKIRNLVITKLGEENKKEHEMDEDEGGVDRDEDEKTHQSEREGEVGDGNQLKTTAERKSSLREGQSAVHDAVPALVNTERKKSGEKASAARSQRPLSSYSLSVYGKGPAFGSTTHSLSIDTGPEPPSDLVFSDVTDSSFTVSWTKPKSRVSGFKITHTHIQEGEPISVSVDSETQRLELSAKAPGSTYEVRVMSLLGQDESDSITETVTTLPDPPTDLKAINVTDSKALLLWRPALATIDHYVIVYSSDTTPGSGITIKVSGNAAEQQLQTLQASTRYAVSIQSRLGDLSSSSTTTDFSTSSGAVRLADGPRDLEASRVTPRSAVLSWRPPEAPVSGYKLSYYTDEQDKKEITLEPTITEIQLSRLFPSSSYTAHLQAQRGGLYMTAISTHFTTGNLRFPFPTDCSQEQQNGALESGTLDVFPQGRTGRALTVYCDMETDGGGWTVFQRRKDGKTNFFRKWREYSSGFGALDGEFWLGNEMLHNFTKMSPMVLRVDLRAGDESAYARYSSFSVESAKKHYTLRVSGYSGTAGDSLSYHNGRPFSTRDKDPRAFITRCAMSYRGGWWYKNCHEANLNGLYDTGVNHQGVIWTAWKGQDFSIPFTEMKFRPASFRP